MSRPWVTSILASAVVLASLILFASAAPAAKPPSGTLLFPRGPGWLPGLALAAPGLGLDVYPNFWNITPDGSDNNTAMLGGVEILGLSRGTGGFVDVGGTTVVDGPAKLVGGGVWVSLPIAAAFTLSGPVTFNIWGRETSSAANAGLIVRVYKGRQPRAS